MDPEDAKLALRWLLRHPFEFEAVLWLAKAEDSEPEDADALMPGYWDTARTFLAGSRPAHCAECYFPVVYLPDGRVRDWTSLDHHNCDPVVDQHRKPKRVSVKTERTI